MNIRYIRDHINGSDINEYSHWVEIQAISNGVNVALGKTVTSDSDISSGLLTYITDGDTNTNLYFEPQINSSWITVDLGSLYDVQEVKVWHYINRTYHESITQVSSDGVNWTTLFDSAIDGEYLEGSQGHSMILETPPPPPVGSWRYLKMVSGGSSSTETNPYEINILAGTTQCQVGGSIESDRPPIWSTLATLIDGNLTTATYWDAGFNPTIIVTMPAGHADLTVIEIPCTFAHDQHTVYLSQDKIEWIECPFLSWTNADNQQNFSIPAFPLTTQNFTANATLNITRFIDGAVEEYVYNEHGGQLVNTPIDWIQGQNVSVSNGTVTKISGGNAWNAGANSSQQSDGTTDFIVEYIPPTSEVRVAIGLDEVADGIEAYRNKDIDWNWEINPSGLNEITVHEIKKYTGTYQAGDIFQVALKNGQIYFYQNGVLEFENTDPINFPLVADCAIYTEGFSITPTLYLLAEPQNFEQFAELNIGLIDNGEKIYTANGYDFNQWSLMFLDFYFYTDTIYTAKGYEFDQVDSEPLTLTDSASQNYTANGYNFTSKNEQEEILLDFSGSQEYTLNGYSFEQAIQENIFFTFLGAESYTADGYDVASMAQENILLVSLAVQTYTPKGLSFEATSEDSFFLDYDAIESFRANFEQSKEELIEFGMGANQTFIRYFSSLAASSLSLSLEAVQDYTNIGYSTESNATEEILLDFSSSQVFSAHFEMAISDPLTLFITATSQFQANFTAVMTQNIFMEDYSSVTTVFSDGLQLQENAQETISFSFGATQIFDSFEGSEFIQNANNGFELYGTGTLVYELGEIGKYNQRATRYLFLQETTQSVYDRNWLSFESDVNELISDFTVSAVNVYQRVYINEMQATESLTWFINPLEWYGKYFGATAQDAISLSINAKSEYSQNHLEFEMNANDFFFIHSTDISLHTVNYLTFKQNMFYDFWFWDYADQIYSKNNKNFKSNITETIDLNINSNGQYTNANMLNSFATESIQLSLAASLEYVEALINHFTSLAIERMDLSFGTSSEHVRGYIFESSADENMDLIVQAFSEYQHINVFVSKAVESLYFEDFGTLLVTTEPRNNIVHAQLNFTLVQDSWVYFESDIYVQTYKIEITKPNTIWEPTEKDRPMVEQNKVPSQGMDYSDTSFGGQTDTKVDRRIKSLTDIKEPSKITYESESQKPNSLYTTTDDYKGGLS